jgi:hypothetical protein
MILPCRGESSGLTRLVLLLCRPQLTVYETRACPAPFTFGGAAGGGGAAVGGVQRAADHGYRPGGEGPEPGRAEEQLNSLAALLAHASMHLLFLPQLSIKRGA